MTSSSTPPAQPKNEAEYARKLALALLSTLESKGFLSKTDVDAILHVAHRAAMNAEPASKPDPEPKLAPADVQEEQPAQAAPKPTETPKTVLDAPVEVKRPLGPAVLGTRWVKPENTPAAVPSDAADLTHESGTVKVTGQASAATAEGTTRKRPLGPAILTGEKATFTPAEETAPVDENRPEVTGTSTSEERTAELDLPATEQDAPAASARKDDSLDDRVPVTESPEQPEKKVNVPVVIDFDMD